MADNYLEKKMEELRSGRLASTGAPRSAAPLPADALVMRYPKLRVLLADNGLTPLGQAMVKAFSAVGCRVAFFATEPDEAKRFQQQTGARCYTLRAPMEEAEVKSALTDLLRNWRDVDVVVGSALSPVLQSFVGVWNAHRLRFPITHGGTLVEWDSTPGREVSALPAGVNRVALTLAASPTAEAAETAARMALFHSHPLNRPASETCICIS